MLYSIGKDSSVMLHLALQGLLPAPPPFPLLHVDTSWKFREMIALPRPRWRARSAWTCSSTSTRRARGAGSIRSHRLGVYTQVMKTEALKQALDSTASTRPSAAPARRGEEPRQGAHLLASAPPATLGPAQPAAGALETCSTRDQPGETIRVFPLSNWTELDVWHTSWPKNPGRAALFRQASGRSSSATAA